MRSFQLSLSAGEPLRILCLGAHCDDIEIGCGGTLMSLLERYPRGSLRWEVLSSTEERGAETRAAAEQMLSGAQDFSLQVQRFPNSYFPSHAEEIKRYLLSQRDGFDPDIVFTHFGRDAHQDHRTVAELTWNLYRDHVVLEYEIPKYDGDLARPNVYCALSRQLCERKIGILTSCFASQARRGWFTAETFAALMRLRGIECNSPGGYAEAFHARKILV